MNIFLLDRNPIIAAQYHCDLHCIKMCCEVQQILCSVYHLKASHLAIPYRLTHKNHPSNKWARASRGNFEWLLQHSRALCEEYTKRYGKTHKSQAVLEWCENHRDELIFDCHDLQPFAIAIGEDKECRKKVVDFDKKSVVDQYRLYYIYDKPFAKWAHSPMPDWYSEHFSKNTLAIL